MTEYEFLDYQASIGSVVVDSAMSFITVFSAYVAATYLVGRKLNLWQSLGLTFAYSIFSLLTIFGLANNIAQLREVVLRHPEFQGDPDGLVVFMIGGPLALVSAWFISVIYMITENRKRETGDNDGAV